MTLRPLLSSVLFGPSLLLGAQSPADQAVLLPEPFLVPIHGAPAEPDAERYGLWAAGPDYKVSFGEGFTFYPLLGDAYPENLPVSWYTESVTAGGVDLVEGRAAERRWTDFRYELRRGDLVEAYDVRADGVEQTFVLHRPPATPGDMVVTGRIGTPLDCAADATPLQRELLFCAGSDGLVRYGKAWAVDADGRRVPMTTTFDGERVRLRLDGEFLGNAAYPVVVDPLTSTVQLNASGLSIASVGSVGCATRLSAVNPRVLVCYTRKSSATDEDGFALLRNIDLSPIPGVNFVFSDITASWSTEQLSACYVTAHDRWVLAYQRAPDSVAYAMDANTATLNLGSAVTLTNGSDPCIGSTSSTALVAYSQGPSITIVDLGFNPVRPVNANIIGGSLSLSLQKPAITPHAPGRGVAIAFEARGPGSTHIQGIAGNWPNGMRRHNITTPSPGVHHLEPRIAGEPGRMLLTYVRTTTGLFTTRSLLARRLDWSGATPLTLSERTVETNPLLENGAVAYDHDTRSHWAVAYRVVSGTSTQAFVARLGYTGASTEGHPLHPTTEPAAAVPAVAFARSGGRSMFTVAYATARQSLFSSHPVSGRVFTYPADALSLAYGNSCATSGIVTTNQPPYAGSEFFQLELRQLPPNTLAIHVLAFAPASIDLGPFGMPGCFRLVDPGVASTVIAVADSVGEARRPLALPDSPLFQGNLFGQWFHLEPGANSLGLVAHEGVRHQVR